MHVQFDVHNISIIQANLLRLSLQGDFFKIDANCILHNALCLAVCYSEWLIAHKL